MTDYEKKQSHTNQVRNCGIDLCVTVSRGYLEIEIEIETNDLIPDSEYSDRQFMVYKIIRYLHQEVGLGYRKISTFMNSWGIKTDRGKEWKNTHVYSVLKRFNQREDRINNQRKKKFDYNISKIELKTE
mgnify:FL=1